MRFGASETGRPDFDRLISFDRPAHKQTPPHYLINPVICQAKFLCQIVTILLQFYYNSVKSLKPCPARLLSYWPVKYVYSIQAGLASCDGTSWEAGKSGFRAASWELEAGTRVFSSLPREISPTFGF